mmetsp:Transcript_103711/g.334346  ORF Transcript_103711/g.334346 Transcript_103711/m.334346 type:complete len:442 (+) Transcript_103711:46-1371(+)
MAALLNHRDAVRKLPWTNLLVLIFATGGNAKVSTDDAAPGTGIFSPDVAASMNLSNASTVAVVAVPLQRLRRRIPRSQNGGYSFLRARDLQASEYFGELLLGSPAQRLRLVFDTGSGNLVVPSTECEDVACRSHTRFDANLSETSAVVASADSDPADAGAGHKRVRETVTITFGTGEITGAFLRDSVCMGDVCTRMNIIAATKESDEPFKDVPFDGILGLGLPQLAEAQEFSLMDSLVRKGLLRRNLFSVFFAKGDQEQSEVLFGDVREERMASPISWVSVSNPGYWQVAMRDMAVAGEPLGLCGSFGCQAALDTGTSLLAGPARLVRRLAERLRVATDCSNLHSLPDLEFLVSGATLHLKPSDYVERTDDLCLLGLMALDIPSPRGPVFILGDPFLRRYYTVYDRERLRVGFALARQAEDIQLGDTGLGVKDPGVEAIVA